MVKSGSWAVRIKATVRESFETFVRIRQNIVKEKNLIEVKRLNGKLRQAYTTILWHTPHTVLQKE